MLWFVYLKSGLYRASINILICLLVTAMINRSLLWGEALIYLVEILNNCFV